MTTRTDHTTVSRSTTATPADVGAPTRRSVGVAAVLAVLALVVIAVWLTVSGPEAGISPAADADASPTSGTDDVPHETLVRNRGVFE